MKASQAGIEVSKAELGALLFFAGGATKDGVVKFRIGGSRKLVACSTDGKRAVECEADAGDHDVGEWAMPADYLETVRRGINKGKTEAVLELGKSGHALARLRGAASKDKHTKIEDESAGTSTQLSMAQVHNLVKRPELEGSWFAILPKNLNRALDVVHKAADNCPITVYPPQESTDALRFEASCEGGRWRGTLPTAVVVAPGDEAEEDEDDEAPGKPEKQPRLPHTGRAKASPSPTAARGGEKGSDGGIVDDNYKPDGIVEGGRKKAAKKTASKGGFVHLIDSASRNGTLCGRAVGTSVGSGGSTSKASVNCPKCLRKLEAKPAAAKKPRARKGA